jgi:putative peptidoglycan lipid II flippase
VAIATVLFPALSRFAAQHDLTGLSRRLAQGLRLVWLLLIPAAAVTLALSTPITRLIYEHGEFGADSTELVSTALFWFSFSLPFNGLNLLLTRTFFSLQRPWLPTAIALASLVLNAAVSLALYGPLGIAGVVIGTAVSSAATTALLWRRAAQELGSVEGRHSAITGFAILSASAVLGALGWIVWALLDELFGRSLLGQLISVGGALTVGSLAYARAVLWLEIAEAEQMARMVTARVPGLAGPLGLR